MTELFYNQYEFHKACSFIDTNPYEAKKLLEDYYKKYPHDFSSKPYYVYVLIILNKIEEARDFLEKIEAEIENDSVFQQHADKYFYTDRGIKLNMIRLLAREKKYLELLNFIQRYPNIMDDYCISFYCRSQLGLLGEERKYNSYYFNQTVSYEEEDFRKHVERHTADYNMDLDDPNPSIFVPDFPLDEVIEEVKKYIPSNKRLCFGMFENTYVFRYDECGRDKNKLVDYFKVICFNDDETHFITMCPSNYCEELPYIDLNYMKQVEKPKQKVLSQIDKFNQRYRKGTMN